MATSNSKPVSAPVSAPVAAAPTPAGKKAATYPETAMVTVLVANPKRGASAARFALYGTVGGAPISVKDYLDKCVALAPDEPRGRWRSDLAWDMARKFISIA